MMTFRIVVVDEHEVVRRGLRALLAAQSAWRVTTEVINGREVIEKAAELRPDLIILDTSLRDPDGPEACSRIPKSFPQIEVLVLTHQDSPFLVRKAPYASIRGYVLKSDAGRELLAAVDAARRHRLFLGSAVSTNHTGTDRINPEQDHDGCS